MKPIFASKMPVLDQQLLLRVKQLFEQLPEDLKLGSNGKRRIVPDCHILAVAMARHLGLRAEHGYFGGTQYYDHSWLLTESNNIIDVYPVGIIGGPFLVDNGILTPGQRIYFPDRSALFITNLSRSWFIRAVNIVYEELSKLG